ncbi:hypothetical protein [Shewanella salipaludis]|uniref:Uncharacterized protein n=1 Tax=Shewanella salipaludis TaxID=2723052 RepID=A0A972JJF9_9GAMM|nr:hypothetical protein [Shewanella salipaludis]NMH66068.1 hypothetical protein [Shewanella salipaludis]
MMPAWPIDTGTSFDIFSPRCHFGANAELLTLNGDRGAKALLEQHHKSGERLLMPLPQAAIDMISSRGWRNWAESCLAVANTP